MTLECSAQSLASMHADIGEHIPVYTYMHISHTPHVYHMHIPHVTHTHASVLT